MKWYQRSWEIRLQWACMITVTTADPSHNTEAVSQSHVLLPDRMLPCEQVATHCRLGEARWLWSVQDKCVLLHSPSPRLYVFNHYGMIMKQNSSMASMDCIHFIYPSVFEEQSSETWDKKMPSVSSLPSLFFSNSPSVGQLLRRTPFAGWLF